MKQKGKNRKMALKLGIIVIIENDFSMKMRKKCLLRGFDADDDCKEGRRASMGGRQSVNEKQNSLMIVMIIFVLKFQL